MPCEAPLQGCFFIDNHGGEYIKSNTFKQF
jgi:hypothetical protein